MRVSFALHRYIAALLLLCLPSAGLTAQIQSAPEAAALEKLLKEYKELADNGGWPEWHIGKPMKEHQADARIPTLRQLLTITGDYRQETAATDHYDSSLIAAVKRFQSRHGITPDGKLGKPTQAALSIPVETRIAQINATLERIREHPLAPEGKFILVNVPAFTLYAVEQGQPILAMRVIIGNRKNHTPLFDNAVTHIIFNPQWHVPQRIARNELTPKLQSDPDYFVRAGFVVTQDGQPVDPMHADPASDNLSFRQLAGAGNALGKIKFDLPDNDDIYLHSTSTPRLFSKDDRALSHGCIRLEHPRELAYFVLRGEAQWDASHIDQAYDGSKERWVNVKNAVPVHLVYWTAFVDAGGTAHFFNDVYGMDKSVTAQRQQEDVITLAAK